MEKKLTISVREAARLLGISGASAYEAARKNDPPVFIKVGRRILVSRAALEKVLADPPTAPRAEG